MKANLKRVLSFVLVMMMILSCVPAVAFAAEDSHAAQNITTGAEYDSLAEAMEAAASGETVKVLADSDAVVTYTAGVILDLNGHNVSNVTVPADVTLTAIDSATDDYEGAFGSLTTDGNVATTVKTTGDVKSYVAIADNGSWSFHRYYAAITAISLKPGSAALGYKAEFYGDEAVKNAVVNYGYEMWLNDYDPKAMSKADKLEKSVLTLRLNNILKEGNDTLNAIGSTASINGKAFITLNLNGEEVTLYSADQTTTLRKTIESINANVAAYSETALQAVRNLCTLYAPWMMGWATENIFGIGAGDTDLDVEVLVPVTAENNVVTAETVVKENNIVVTIPAGVQLADGADNLVLTIVDKDSSDSDVEAAEGEALRPMDVHIEGISADNTTPVIICLGNVLPKGLNIGNYDLYHVEDGKTVAMTRANSISELDAHNEFCYDPATGAVTVAVCSFSEIALSSNSSNPWNGNADRSWYDANKASFEIHNADQLAGLGALVDSGTTFDGKTIVMIRDINLYGLDANNERLSFNPIGFGYDDNQVFKGTFDGNGNTIFNLYQNCWSLGADVYTYSTAGGGLFAYVVDADFKNLIIDNAEIVLECIDMGSLVGYAYGTCSFTNIIVRNSKVANHNRYTGGVVGEVNGNHTFYNVDVEESTTLSGLWGSFGAACGGIIGGKWGDATVHMEKCDVACTLDVFNDVTSAYQWYAYRFCGMLIGNTEQSRTDNGRTTAKADFLTTKDCTVVYGDWAKYHYCEFSKMENLGARYPWVRVEPGLYTDPYSNIRYGHPIVNGETISSDNHDHAHEPGDGHMLEASFHQLYGGDQGVYGGNWHVTDNLGVTEIDAPAPVQKFAENYDKRYPITEGTTLTLGQLFKASGLGTIQNLDVHAYVSPVNANDSVRGTFTKDNGDWTNSKLTFTGSGMAEITITDYYYCTATTMIVNVLPGALRFQYRYGTNNLIQVNTNLPSNTPCVNFTASDNGCNIDQSANQYQQFGWVGMENVDGTIVFTFHFNGSFEAGQTYVLPRGAVFGFTDGTIYELKADYTFTFNGSSWSTEETFPVLTLAYRYSTDKLIQYNTNLSATTPTVDFLTSEKNYDITQEGDQQTSYISMVNADGTIVLTFNFANAFTYGQKYTLRQGSVFIFTDNNMYELDRDYTFYWNGEKWVTEQPCPQFSMTYDSGNADTANTIKIKTSLPANTPAADFLTTHNGCDIRQYGQHVGWIGMSNADGVVTLIFHFNSAFEAGNTYSLGQYSIFGFTDGNTYSLDKTYVFTWDGSSWTVS